MDVIQAIKERRSIRNFRQDTVSEEDLNIIFEAARWAPSWHNTQCLRLIVVRNQATKSKLAETLMTGRAGRENPAAEAVRNAPVIIIACAERGISGFYLRGEKGGTTATEKGEWWFMFDVGLAMQNVAIASYALGFGTVHVGLFDAGRVATILGLPDNITVVEIMPLGRPDESPTPPKRKDISEFVFQERYPG